MKSPSHFKSKKMLPKGADKDMKTSTQPKKSNLEKDLTGGVSSHQMTTPQYIKIDVEDEWSKFLNLVKK